MNCEFQGDCLWGGSMMAKTRKNGVILEVLEIGETLWA